MKLLFILAFSFVAFSCTTYPPVQVPGVPTYSESEYKRLFEEHTQTEQKYNGLINTMIVGVTHITPSLAEAILSKKAQIHQWDEGKYQSERSEVMAALSRETQFFVTLYTPTQRMDDISRKRDLWHLFLDVDGQRYEGTANQVKGTLEEIEPVYPPHNRFSQPYIVSFPVPAHSVTTNFEFLLTGPLDSAKVKF